MNDHLSGIAIECEQPLPWRDNCDANWIVVLSFSCVHFQWRSSSTFYWLHIQTEGLNWSTFRSLNSSMSFTHSSWMYSSMFSRNVSWGMTGSVWPRLIEKTPERSEDVSDSFGDHLQVDSFFHVWLTRHRTHFELSWELSVVRSGVANVLTESPAEFVRYHDSISAID